MSCAAISEANFPLLMFCGHFVMFYGSVEIRMTYSKTPEIFRFVTYFLLLIEIVHADMICIKARFSHDLVFFEC